MMLSYVLIVYGGKERVEERGLQLCMRWEGVDMKRERAGREEWMGWSG